VHRTVFRGPDFVSGQDARRRKSAAYISWLEATPTFYLSSQYSFFEVFLLKYVGAASCRDTNFDDEQHSPGTRDRSIKTVP
jgi:hypothetical protein